MAEDFQQERTEQATPRRREEARQQGQVAVSQDLSPAVILTAGAGLLWWSSQSLCSQLRHLLQVELRQAYHPEFSIAHAILIVQWAAGLCIGILLPFLAVLGSAAFLTSALQVGFYVTWEPLRPDWSRLSWNRGWSRLWSVRSAARGGMLALKLAVGVAIALWFVHSRREWIIQLGRAPLWHSVAGTWTASLLLMLFLGGALLTMGVLDYLFQRWQLERSLMMTRQEIREEHKRLEGDPQVKSRIRRAQREMLKMQMLRKVRLANVVLTNPTHIAVALQYDRATMKAPRVIAKGKGPLAKRISRLAQLHGIPVLERKPLARALYATVGLDQEIPPNLYRAIAEILAHVLRLKRSKSA